MAFKHENYLKANGRFGQKCNQIVTIHGYLNGYRN